MADSRSKFTTGGMKYDPADRDRYLSMPIEERRQQYACKDRFVTLDQLPTWDQQLQEERLQLEQKGEEQEQKGEEQEQKGEEQEQKGEEQEQKGEEQEQKGEEQEGQRQQEAMPEQRPREEAAGGLASRVSLFRGDITTLEVDAIVNAANSSLLGGGGVDGAIHRAAGRLLLAECAQLRGCGVGEAKATCGYRLPARYVLHTVGPTDACADSLRACYGGCLGLARSLRLRSLAFPCIATGVYGFPNQRAARVALQTVRDFLVNDDYGRQLQRVVFCVFLDIDLRLYRRLLPEYFPAGR